MKHLFVYGSLLFDEVVERVIGRRVERAPASLDGFQRCQVIGELYPGLKPQKGSRVNGGLILNLTPQDFANLDQFEGGMYQRGVVSTKDQAGRIVPAEVYITRGRYLHCLAREDWSEAEFGQYHLQRFLNTYP